MLTPAAISPDARPWTALSDATSVTVRLAGHIEELQASGAEVTTAAVTTANTTTTTTPATTSTVATTTTTASTSLSAAPPTPSDNALPALGRATASGCDAALTYLRAYAATGFALECPGDAEGHQGMTCINEPGACPNGPVIAIADPCPQAYMNEASNSWVLTGRSDAPIDPYGTCP